jgi:hypothetical protein
VRLFNFRLLASALLAMLSLSGCAINPIVSWDRPAEPAGSLDSMEVARAQADAYKRALHVKAREYVGAQNQLNDSLLGLGVLALGAAASTAHADVFRVLGFSAGATYLFGVQNLGKPRLEVYQAGIGATNCAVAAVRPLQYGAADLLEIASASRDIRPALSQLAVKLALARAAYAAEPALADALDRQVRDQLEAAAASHNAALAVMEDAAALPVRVRAAAGELKSTLETISAQVDKLASNTVVDPSTIPRSLTSLASVVGMFTPGLKLDAAFAARIAGRAEAQSLGDEVTPPEKSTAISSPLAKAIRELASAQSDVDALVKPLAKRIESSKGHASSEALKACGVSDSVIALRADPEEVRFTFGGDETQSTQIHVAGGAKNYTGRFLESPTRGVELVQPQPGEGTFEVRVPKTVTTAFQLTLRIADSSAPPQTKTVRIKVEAPAAASTGDAQSAGQVSVPAGAKDLEKVRQSLAGLHVVDARSFQPKGSANIYVFNSSSIKDNKLLVKMTCKPGAGAEKDARLNVVNALLQHAKGKKVLKDETPVKVRQRIVPQDVANCMS